MYWHRKIDISYLRVSLGLKWGDVQREELGIGLGYEELGGWGGGIGIEGLRGLC